MNNNSYRKPSRIGRWILAHFLRHSDHDTVMGDFEEYYYEKYDRYGLIFAYLWFWTQVLKSMPSFLKTSLYRSIGMFKNYFKIAVRNMRRNKVYSFINISGLAIGMAGFTLIMLYVQHETSFDSYHENAENIYNFYTENPGDSYNGSNKYARTAAPLGPTVVDVFPEVLSTARIRPLSHVTMSYESKKFFEGNFYGMDASAFSIFTFPFVVGDPESVLDNPFSMAISESTAKRYFGSDNAINKIVTLVRSEKQYDFTITGVFKDVKPNSAFAMDMVIPLETLSKIVNRDINHWGYGDYHTFILVKERTEPRKLEAKLPEFIENYADLNAVWEYQGQRKGFYLTPLKDLHFRTGVNFELGTHTDKRFILFLSSLAILILLIACINYMNLATAKSLKRGKEVGIRKVVGALKYQLVKQFLSESVLFTIVALLLSGVLIVLAFPTFNMLVERQLELNVVDNLPFLLGMLAVFFVVGLFAGSYPAFHIASFRPVNVLRGSFQRSSRGSALRNILVVTQFSISTALIFCTFVVSEQLNYIKSTDVGYSRDQIVVTHLSDKVLRENVKEIKAELLKNPEILGVTGSSSLPNRISTQNFVKLPDRKFPIYTGLVDRDFIDLFEIEIIQGRSFSKSDLSSTQFILNEAAVKAMGWEDGIGVGKEFAHWNKIKGPVIGVVKDFNMRSLHLGVEPVYFYLRDDGNYAGYLSIKIRGNTIPETIAHIKKTFEGFSTKEPFSYSFFDDLFNRAYRSEERMGSIFSSFASLAVFIACLGLFGLSSFTAEQRTKEIGVRKVLGASQQSIMMLLSKEFIRWVVAANIIAWPIAYYFMNNWLQNFAFKMELSISLFLYSGAFALAIAFLTVSFQTIKAAIANPITSLRYE